MINNIIRQNMKDHNEELSDPKTKEKSDVKIDMDLLIKELENEKNQVSYNDDDDFDINLIVGSSDFDVSLGSTLNKMILNSKSREPEISPVEKFQSIYKVVA
jgi:hypothetical protein